MTTLVLADMARDEALAPFLRRYREAALREITEANRPRLMALIEQIQPATAALLDGGENQVSIAAIKEAARLATRGHWERRHDDEVWTSAPDEVGRHVADATYDEDAEFIALANPTAILSLIDRLERAEAALGAVHDARPVAYMVKETDIHGRPYWFMDAADSVGKIEAVIEGVELTPLIASPVPRAALQSITEAKP